MDEETSARIGVYIQDAIGSAIEDGQKRLRQDLEGEMQDYAALVAKRLGFDHGRAFETEPGVWKILLFEQAVVVDFTMEKPDE